MNTIIGLVLTGAALLAAATAQTTSDQVSQATERPAPAGELREPATKEKTKEGTDVQAAPKIQSTMERGVLVVRHGIGAAVGAPAADKQLAADRALVSARRVAIDKESARQPVLRPWLRRVHIDEPWKYIPTPELSQEELKRLWTYQPKTNWKYRPVPERSQAEVERLTAYRPMLSSDPFPE